MSKIKVIQIARVELEGEPQTVIVDNEGQLWVQTYRMKSSSSKYALPPTKEYYWRKEELSDE